MLPLLFLVQITALVIHSLASPFHCLHECLLVYCPAWLHRYFRSRRILLFPSCILCSNLWESSDAEGSKSKKRQRIFHRRSRNGCHTCKLRHLRCDESTPVVSHNCAAKYFISEPVVGVVTLVPRLYAKSLESFRMEQLLMLPPI